MERKDGFSEKTTATGERSNREMFFEVETDRKKQNKKSKKVLDKPNNIC